MKFRTINEIYADIKEFINKKFTSPQALQNDEEQPKPYRDLIIKLALFISLLIFLGFLFPSGVSFQYANLKVGMITPEKIVAPFTFPILKTEDELQEERNHVMQTVEDVFKKDTLTYEIELIKFANLVQELERVAKKKDGIAAALLQEDSLSAKMRISVDSILYDLKIKYGLILNVRNLKTFFTLIRDKKLNAFEFQLNQFLHQVYGKGIIDVPRYKLLSEKIRVIIGDKEVVKEPDEFFHLSEATSSIKRRSSRIFKKKEAVELVIPFIEAFCKPNLYFQPELTAQRRKEAVKKVPLSKGFIYEDQLIIDKGEVVTPETYNILNSLAVAQAEKGILGASAGVWLNKLGIYTISLLLLLIFVLYLYIYRSRTFKDNKLLLLIYLIFMFQFAINFLFINILGWPHRSMPIMLLPIMLAMLIDSRTAFTATFIAAFFTAAMVGMDIYFALYTITTGIASIFATRRIRKRSDSIRAVLIVFVVYALTYLSLGFLRFASITELLKELVIPLVITGSFMFISYMLISVLEKLFDLVTDITLLELSDLNSPLLKKLSVESPGTFHHSLIMGNLAEAAAEKIDANPLLARVGCYYHDIGKMEMPEYFVENQMGAMNRHESLQPNMSALILSNHVKNGIKLAEKYNLPSAVKNFIPEHHGTSRMEYFYHKAKEMSGDKEPDDADFRYPGPKPQSKETAIAMLADGIEAAVRSLKNPIPGKIRQMVNELVNKKFAEGELEQCDLTLKDLQVIKEAFIPILLGIHHHRIEYPKDENSGNDDKKVKDNQDKETTGENESGSGKNNGSESKGHEEQ